MKGALASKHQEVEAKAKKAQDDSAEVSKEKELGGTPLQQMPGVEMKLDMISGKSTPFVDGADDNADLSKIQVHYDGSLKATGNENVEMEDAAKGSSNGAPHGLPHETVPQPNLDTVK